MVSGNWVKPRFTASGTDVIDGLHAKTFFGTFVNVIWTILEKRSVLPDIEVGQICAVKTIANN